ncbi:uncharacterized protein I303_107599 [Kwoniella dejecticola CBS 10117]|uniref:Uncharacterized protein n=1 Tax=Kwoniella dejecticola CBS 10117 TaxID=1296121 RepID=A0A1A5ZV68_9TREE|nr:uncharacterized protein I303_07610 [Kwoniella dejecticola CBS 10117]OBR81700.1 hypothetical protein I303_07610 [Kwoniella dejecticola CBS 10117]
MLPQLMRRSEGYTKPQKNNDRPAENPDRARRAVLDPIWSLVVLILLGGARGQTTNATCTSTDSTSWMFNADGESPCLVWSKIQALCLPETSYINVPPLLDQSYSYNLPTARSSPCQCNSVSYSLMSACALCQFPNTSVPPESEWSNHCSDYTNDGLGFNETVLAIPAFAFHHWAGGDFNLETAQSSSNIPTTSYSTTLSRSFASSTSTRSSTSSPSSSITSESTSTASPASSHPSNNEDDDSSVSWGPIIGGAAGGLVLLVILILLIRWLFTRNKPVTRKESIRTAKTVKPLTDPYGNDKENEDSFLEMLNSRDDLGSGAGGAFGLGRLSSKSNKDKRQQALKRRTEEIMSNPNAFADPRTAPIPFTPTRTPFPAQRPNPPNPPNPSSSKRTRFASLLTRSDKEAQDRYTYTTTSQRLRDKSPSITDSDLERLNRDRDHDRDQKQEGMLIPPRQRYSHASSFSANSDDSYGPSVASPRDWKEQSESKFRSGTVSISQPKAAAGIQFLPKRYSSRAEVEHPSMDFSVAPTSPDQTDSELDIADGGGHRGGQGRKGRISEVATLPSIYEPTTGSKPYRRSSMGFFSPASQYPLTAKSPETSKSRSKYYSQYTLDEYPGQETLLAKLKQVKNHRDSTLSARSKGEGEGEGTIGAALGSGKRGSWWDRRWSRSTTDSI